MAYGAILGKSTTTWTNEQILSDATSALFGLGADAVPDDVLNKIYEMIGNESQVIIGSYVGNKTPRKPGSSGLTAYQSAQTITLGFKPKAVVVTTNWCKRSGGSIRYEIPVFCMFTELNPFKCGEIIGEVSFFATGEVTSNGFVVGNSQIVSEGQTYDAQPFLNENDKTYSYIAIK